MKLKLNLLTILNAFRDEQNLCQPKYNFIELQLPHVKTLFWSQFIHPYTIMQDDQQVTESTYLSQHHTTITDHVTAWSIIGCIYNYLISKMLQQLRNSRDSRCTDPSGKWREILFHRENYSFNYFRRILTQYFQSIGCA